MNVLSHPPCVISAKSATDEETLCWPLLTNVALMLYFTYEKKAR